MKITFVYPKWGKKGLTSVAIFRMPPLGLVQLASLTPEGWEVEIVDENIRELDFGASTNLVALSAITALAPRAYAIADKYRQQGISVIMGGIHASMFPQETVEHVDSVVIGEADSMWPEILNDFKTGGLKKIYQAKEYPDLTCIFSKRQVSRKIQYPFPFPRAAIVQTSRGCPFACDFCSVSRFNGRKIRHRPIASVVHEIEKSFGGNGYLKNYLFFADDNIVADPTYAFRLFGAIKPLDMKWLSQTDIRIALNEKLLKSAVESGLTAVFIGFEAIDKDSLDAEICRTKAKWRSRYEEAVKRLHDYGVVVEGAFVFGLDSHTKDVFKRTVEWAINQNIDIAQFTIATPFPGTVLFERLHQQDRITALTSESSYDWQKFNAFEPVFQPAQMSSDDLQEGLRWAYQNFYSCPSIFSRMWRASKKRSVLNTLFTGLVNLDFRHFQA